MKHSIGQLYRTDNNYIGSVRVYLLVTDGNGKVGLVNIKTGSHFIYFYNVKDCMNISKTEWGRIAGKDVNLIPIVNSIQILELIETKYLKLDPEAKYISDLTKDVKTGKQWEKLYIDLTKNKNIDWPDPVNTIKIWKLVR